MLASSKNEINTVKEQFQLDGYNREIYKNKPDGYKKRCRKIGRAKNQSLSLNCFSK